MQPNQHSPYSEKAAARALGHVLKASDRLFGIDAGAVYVANYAERDLVCLAHSEEVRPAPPPTYAFNAKSFVSQVFRTKLSHQSVNPANDPEVDRRGIQYFQIRSAITGAPLGDPDRVRGVVVLWSRSQMKATVQILERATIVAALAAHYLTTAIQLDDNSAMVRQLPQVAARLGNWVTQEEALRAVMQAISPSAFDRVRFFRYSADSRVFVPVDCFGMDDRETFLRQAAISADSNPYAKHTVLHFPSNPKARTYPECWSAGPDPDAATLQKSADLPWAVVPLGVSGELIGQIVVDNAKTGRPITDDSEHFLDAMSALTTAAIANRQSVQFLSLEKLPVLYSSIPANASRLDVIRRLLVFLTCGESYGFSRALFLEWYDSPDRLTYRASIGSLNELSFRRIASIASQMSLATILAKDNYDYEIDQKLSDFVIDLRDTRARTILDGVAWQPISLRSETASAGSEASLAWQQDIAARIGETDILAIPLRLGNRTLGMFMVDRQWQTRRARDVDLLAMRTFSQIATRILEQNQLQQQNASQRTETHWREIEYVAVHAVKGPLAVIEPRLSMLEAAVEGSACVTEVREHLGYVRRAVDQIRGFIHDFLQLAQSFEISPRPIALLPLLIETWNSIAKDNPRLGVTRIDCYEGIVILGDVKMLQMCCVELITNALQFSDKQNVSIKIDVTTPSPSWVPQSLDSSQRYAVVHFDDNGCGIDPSHESKMFKPGFTTRQNSGGTGIGLFMVKQFVEAHHGAVFWYSYKGLGTTISLFLPLATVASAGSVETPVS